MMKRKSAAKVKMSLVGVAAVTLMSAGLAMVNQAQTAKARDYNAEIKALQNQINEYSQKSSELAAQSSTLQGKISELQNQQNSIQAQIDLTTAQQAQLSQQITDTEAKIKSEAQALSKILQAQYYSSQTSALDVLMNSESVSDYVDRQTRQQSISDQTQSKVAEIKQLKADLQSKKAQVDQLKAQQESQKQDLADSQAEQQQLLNETQGQEAKYQELSKQASAKKAQIQKEQQAWIASLQRSNPSAAGQIVANSQCGGGYPFCKATPDSTQRSGGFQAFGNARECVNYVQWRIYRLTGRNELHGNAKDWSAVANSSAKANTAGIMTGGKNGHIVWVEQVGTGAYEGQIYVSEYNWRPYSYTERWAPISAFNGGFYDPLG